MVQAIKVQDGDLIDKLNTAAISAGQIVVANGILEVYAADRAANTTSAYAIGGLYDVEKTSAAMTIGNNVFWDEDANVSGLITGTGALTESQAEGNCFGWLTETTVAGDTRTKVKRYGFPVEKVAQVDAFTLLIADPGNAAAIPVATSGYVPIVTTAAETRTIAAPTFIGQQLSLNFQTDGGDAVVTVATTINQVGNNTITFADAGDVVVLLAKQNGANIRWSVLLNDGAALSTV